MSSCCAVTSKPAFWRRRWNSAISDIGLFKWTFKNRATGDVGKGTIDAVHTTALQIDDNLAQDLFVEGFVGAICLEESSKHLESRPHRRTRYTFCGQKIENRLVKKSDHIKRALWIRVGFLRKSRREEDMIDHKIERLDTFVLHKSGDLHPQLQRADR
jgi:hypothetical protein